MKSGDMVVWFKDGGRPKAALFLAVTSTGLVCVEVNGKPRSVPLHEVFVRGEPKT